MHFTRLSQLKSILQRGLLTRDVLVSEGNLDALNDRYCGNQTNAISLSVAFPDYKIFRELRQCNPRMEWIVMAISPRVLWQNPCAFCVQNGAAARVLAIPLEQRMTPDAFRAMYGDFDDKTRIQLALTDDLPTHPQAEILMMAGIAPQDILGILVQNETMKAKVEALRPRLNVRIQPRLFGDRSDYAHW